MAEALNARGTLNVLEAARRAGVDRVVYALDDLGLLRRSRRAASTRRRALGRRATSTPRPSSPARCTARAYRELYDVESTILRFGIPYGPRARPAAVIPAFVRKALAGEPLTIAGDGTQSRRFVYVEDLAEGVARRARAAAPPTASTTSSATRT